MEQIETDWETFCQFVRKYTDTSGSEWFDWLSGSLDTMLASRQFCLAFILLLYCFSLAFVFLLSWGKTGIRCENSFNVTNNLKIIYCTKDKQLWDVTTLSK